MPKISIYDEFKTNTQAIKNLKSNIKDCDNLIRRFEKLTLSELKEIHDTNPIRTCKQIRNDNEAKLVLFERKKSSLVSDIILVANSNKVITNIEILYDITDTVKNILNEFIEYERDLTISLNLARHKISIYTAFIINMNFLQNYEKAECPVCYEKPTHIVTTKCNHCYCEECLYGAINSFYNDRFLLKDKNNKVKCPTCRAIF